MKKLIIILTAFIFLFAACDSKREFIPPLEASFANQSNILYGIPDVGTPKIVVPVSITTTSKNDTKISISVSSPTGAQEGEQYTISGKEVTIPAGKALDSLIISPKFEAYDNGRIDTLVLTITTVSNGVPFEENNVLTVVLRQQCSFVATNFAGVFDVVDDPWADFSQNNLTSTTVTVIDNTTLSFPSPVSGNPVVLKVNPVTNEITINSPGYGNYGDGPITVVTSGGVANNFVSTCDPTITLHLNYLVGSSMYSGGPYLLILKKR